VIEITENMLLDDLQSAIDVLHSIHKCGCKIAIDDFGTGYSSLGYLQQLPLDNLKVDKSFISNLLQGQDGSIIAKAIIALAHSLGLSVVAEGVETKEQLDFMHSLGCEEIQGYFYAPAMPLEEFETWVRKFNGRQD
jgi:EAL domain-containing protein (putative c-di-GMP-specific phosphodiesterase class I)